MSSAAVAETETKFEFDIGRGIYSPKQVLDYNDIKIGVYYKYCIGELVGDEDGCEIKLQQSKYVIFTEDVWLVLGETKSCVGNYLGANRITLPDMPCFHPGKKIVSNRPKDWPAELFLGNFDRFSWFEYAD